MGNTPMFLHAVDPSTYVFTITFAPFTFYSVVPHCYTVDRGVNERWYIKLAREMCDAGPLLHLL